MNETLQRIQEQIRRLNQRLTRAQKLALGALLLLLVGGTAFLAWKAGQPDYATLYTGLTDEEAGAVVGKLQEKKVPYRVADDGHTIQVPSAKVGELRVTLAAEGGPTGSISGYKLIDQHDMFGMPDEIIQLNKQRILEGELAKSIEALEEVRSARVHLAAPSEALFVEDDRPPTASVVLTLEPGAILSDRQVQGILNLVAGAVPKLDTEHVSIVDQHGKALDKKSGDEADRDAALAYQRKVEAELERKATSVLEKFAGPGKAVVRVSAKLDFSNEERTEETFDPDGQVIRSEEVMNESRQNGADRVGGAAGANANDPNVAQGVVRVGDATSTAREKTVTNYEISRVTKKVHNPVARILRLSVAALVDGNYVAGADGKSEYKARTPEEIETIRRLVGSAVELDADRGDQIEVANVQFQESKDLTEAALQKMEKDRFITMAIRYGLILLLALVLIFVVFRPLVRWLVAPPEAAEEVVEQGQLPREEQLALPGEEALAEIEEQPPRLIEQIRELAKEHPDVAASVVRQWLKSAQA
jgi:flagellar M-ring protein FliF